jgi:hypothetical protein
MACELQPLGVVRLFAWVIALVGAQRGLHIVSDAKGATDCRGGTALRAFPFLSVTKLPFALARYLQIREFIFDASHSIITSRSVASAVCGLEIRGVRTGVGRCFLTLSAVKLYCGDLVCG